jgi:hypothetical protein
VKSVVSVSLGSPAGDFEVEMEAGGERFWVRRIGTDGDKDEAAALVGQYDGRVDAIGLGGVNLYYQAGPLKYPCGDGLRIKARARKTPVVDGAGFKRTFEREVPAYLGRHGIAISQRTVLVVSALDRWALAEGFEEEGARVLVGDAAFALRLPVVFPGLAAFGVAARITMWALGRIPIERLYPVGPEQGRNTPRFSWIWSLADIVAGDFHLIKRYMPERLLGRWIVTTTTTAEDREMLRVSEAAGVVTMTPPLAGRTFGANVFEAMAVAAAGHIPSWEEYRNVWRKMGLVPHVERFS